MYLQQQQRFLMPKYNKKMFSLRRHFIIIKYLDALAQQRLCVNVRDEIDSFLKGLNGIIPDNLLSIFDENELEVGIVLLKILLIIDLMKNCLQFISFILNLAASLKQSALCCK